MNESERKEYQKRLEKTLTEYKELKDRSHGSVCNSVENNGRAIHLLKEKNKTESEMLNDGASIEEVREAAKQAYKDAGLYQGEENK